MITKDYQRMCLLELSDPWWGSEPFLHPLHEFQVIVVMERWNTSQHDKEYDLGQQMSAWSDHSSCIHFRVKTKSAIFSVLNIIKHHSTSILRVDNFEPYHPTILIQEAGARIVI